MIDNEMNETIDMNQYMELFYKYFALLQGDEFNNKLTIIENFFHLLGVQKLKFFSMKILKNNIEFSQIFIDKIKETTQLDFKDNEFQMCFQFLLFLNKFKIDHPQK